ncbi:phage protein Gp36 family protein [Massilibacteroides sp.]|uniref:phage protein Gp36 family protein n=1 Tax=Massilibacteroides sp. TaxID=2034766 RepID=UPI00261D9BCD|nr:phage protein Gp36 family protein [Massilibacteroides sp.]MDD4516478.1 DUF1320 family protein [Massilibacteroides sp.]
MFYLTEEDYSSVIDTGILNLFLEKGSNPERGEEMAKGYIYSNLRQRFDLDAEFAREGTARNLTLLRWMLYISVYNLYNTVQDLEIPERITKNYDDARKEITAVAAGKMPTDLIPILESGKAKTTFRWGSSPKRTHSPY